MILRPSPSFDEPSLAGAPRASWPAKAGERAAHGEPAAITSLTRALGEAKRRATDAERALMHVRRELTGALDAAQEEISKLSLQVDATAGLSEARGEALAAALEQYERVAERVGAIEAGARDALARRRRQQEELADLRRLRERDLAERAELRAQLAEQARVHRLAAAQVAAERASLAEVAERLAAELTSMDERLRDTQDRAEASIRLAEERATDALAQAREAVRRNADSFEIEADLRAEVDRAQRERSDAEARHEAELELAGRQAAEAAARLADSERQMRELERQVEREREIADDAVRWASRVERDVVLAGCPDVAIGDPAAEAPEGDAPAALRRRNPRLRLLGRAG